MTPPKPLDIDCPSCNAMAGEHCEGGMYSPPRYHQDRIHGPSPLDELAELRTEGVRRCDLINQLQDHIKEAKDELAELRKENERLRTERDELAAKVEEMRKLARAAFEVGVKSCEDVERETVEAIAAWLDKRCDDVSGGVYECIADTAKLIRSMAWRPPGSDSRGGG